MSGFLATMVYPYPILNQSEITYKEDIRFIPFKEDEIDLNILIRDLFTKHLIMLGRSVEFYDFSMRWRKPYDSIDEYIESREKLKEKSKFLSINIFGYGNLKRMHLNIIKYYSANSMNPNNPAYKTNMDDRSNQMNQNHPEYKDDED